MRDLFFYAIIGGLVLGLAVGTVLSVSLSILFFILLLTAGVVVFGRRKGEALSPRVHAIALFCIFLTFGLLRTLLITPVTTPALDAKVGTNVTFHGVVVRDPEVSAHTKHLYVRSGHELTLVYADRNAPVIYGDAVTVSGKLERPESFTTDLGRTFNYPGYLRARGVGYTVSFPTVSVVAHGRGNWLVAPLLVVKHHFMNTIEQVIPEPAVGLGEGLLLGVSASLGATYEAAFRATGITHIIVLSGYNVMLVVTFFMTILAYVLPYRARLLTGIIGISLFALMVGLSATVVRASVMASLVLLARFHGMTSHILRALALAGLVMLLWNPYLLLYDIGFQLSFVSTLALILVAPTVETWFTRVPDWHGLREFLVATITTQLCVMPLILYQIGQASLVAVFVNVLVLPVVSSAMLLTFITGVTVWVLPPLATLVGYVAYLSLMYILTVATTFAAIPFATVTVPAFGPWWLLAIYLVLGLAWWRYQVYRRTHIRVLAPVSTTRSDAHDLAGWTIVSEEVLKTAGEFHSPAVSHRNIPY